MTYSRKMRSSLNGRWTLRMAFSWIFPSPNWAKSYKSSCKWETWIPIVPPASVGRPLICVGSRADLRTKWPPVVVVHWRGLQTDERILDWVWLEPRYYDWDIMGIYNARRMTYLLLLVIDGQFQSFQGLAFARLPHITTRQWIVI